METLYSIPPLLTLCCFMSLAVLILLRGAKTRLNRLFFAICMLDSCIYASILFAFNTASASSALRVSRLDHLIIPLLVPLYIHFFHEYLQVTHRKWLLTIAYGYATILMCLAPAGLYIAGMTKYDFGFVAEAGPLYIFFALGEAASTVYVLVLVYGVIRREKNSARKNRLKYVLTGVGSLGLFNGLNFLTIHGLPVYPPGNFSFIPLSIFAVGLFKHDLLDMGMLIHKSLVYSFLTAFLTCLYALIIIIANRLFASSFLSDSLLFPVSFFFLITFIFGPLKSGVQDFVDRLFFKKKYDYRATLKQLSRQIVSVLDTRAIGQQLLSTVQHAMQVQRCQLFLKHDTQGNGNPFYQAGMTQIQPDPGDQPGYDALVQFMKTERRLVVMEDLVKHLPDKGIQSIVSCMKAVGAILAIPFVFKDHLNGFLLLGEKRSGDMFTREDMDLLETVCSQSALAIENAMSYQKIDALNNHLEKKVADRTQALKAALKEKERTQEQLIRSESLAAIGQLVAGVAHELNNPLASAISLIQTVVEDMEEEAPGSQDGDAIDDLRFAGKELGRAKSIVRSLLGLSRRTDTYKEKVNINAVVKDAFRILYNQHRHLEVRVEENYGESLPYVQGNFATLGQVTLNILQNALQAVMEQKGGVFLSTRYDIHAHEVVFECADTGPGISPGIQKDIFKPFFTTKEVGQGTGLGLYISHEIVRKHGGSLTFESNDGQGARFMVRLPASGQT